MNEPQPWEFTCKTCGGHKLTVYRIWSILAGPESETWQEWGPLEANHRWRFEFKEKIEKEKEQGDVDRWDFGEYTKDNSSSKPKDYEMYEPEENPGNDRFYVNCAGCDREVEFGWSQPNRGGRIYPVECSDFIPEKVWPDPKYVKIWKKKGWLSKKPVNMSENKDVVQVHGCIVCGRLLNVLAVYAPDGKLVGCTVTSPGGHCVPDENQLLAACDTHTADDIESAYKRWQSRNEKELDDEQEDE